MAFHELLPVARALVACSLHPRLDREQRLPGGEHVRVGRHIRRVADAGAVVVNAHGRAIGGLMFARVRRFHPVVALPEMGAFQEFQPRGRSIHGLQAVDKAEHLRFRAGSVELAQLLDEGQDRGADHDVVEDLGLRRDLREVAGKLVSVGGNRDSGRSPRRPSRPSWR